LPPWRTVTSLLKGSTLTTYESSSWTSAPRSRVCINRITHRLPIPSLDLLLVSEKN
jgi:hypothetical protein